MLSDDVVIFLFFVAACIGSILGYFFIERN